MPSVLILAGGMGERFWPVSTAAKPKQYLPLTGNQPMILETINRVMDLVGPKKVYVVTTREQSSLAYKVLSDLPAENVIVEPEGCNTAPCLVLSVTHIKRKEGKGEVVAVLPSDHFIGDTEKFRESLLSAFTVAGRRQEIVTFGIKPDRPETGYGYISIGPEIASGIFRGLEFVEKPDYPTAQNYLNSGNYLWNSGMFIFQIETFIEMLRKHSPELYTGFLGLEKAKDSEAIAGVYIKMPRTSIDYGLMERISSFLVIPGSFGWDDLGTWRSLEIIHPKDVNGNTVIGNAEVINVENSVIYARDKVIAAIGVKDLVIVEGLDAILVSSKDQIKEVKQILARLKTCSSRSSVAKEE